MIIQMTAENDSQKKICYNSDVFIRHNKHIHYHRHYGLGTSDI